MTHDRSDVGGPAGKPETEKPERDRTAETTAGSESDAAWRVYAEAAVPALVFLVLFGVSLYVVEWLGRTGPLDGYTEGVATAAVTVLRMFGIDARAQGAQVLVGSGAGVQVGWQCCGLSLAVPVAAFFLAFPAPLGKRLAAAMIGFVAVQAVNVLRVAALVVISDRARQYLVLSHDTFWNAFVITVVLLVWILWSGRLSDESATPLTSD
jgi:exosortase/archaeosortase family protein